MINRTIAPTIHPISTIVIPQIHKTQFANGLVVYYLPIANTNIVDFNLQFKAGTICHSNILVPTYANRQLQEGTSTKTAHQIADMFDFFGASMRSAASYDDAHIGFASLRKHTNSLLNLVFEMITQPLFGENELRVNLLRGKENLKQQLQKPEYLSRLLFRENLFGKHHPYGKQAIEADYDTLQIADLKTFHAQYYSPNNAFLFVSGNVDELLIKQLEQIFGSNDWKQIATPLSLTNNIETASVKKYINHVKVFKAA